MPYTREMQWGHRLAAGDDSKGTLHNFVHAVVGNPQAVMFVPIILACVVSPVIRGALLVRSSALAGPVRNHRGAALRACALAGALPRRACVVVDVIVFLLLSAD
jgi:hypothetical protein